MKRVILEICADTADLAVGAWEAGADRIELCSALALGGLTPSYGCIAETIVTVAIPVFVLIRPRSGDFCYTDREFRQMLTEIDIAKKIGAMGVVSGILGPDHRIDVEATRNLVDRVSPLDFTFHRAFDFAPEPCEALEDVIATGAKRLLTSGHQNSAPDGIGLIAQLIKQAAGRLTVMPGAGINAGNVEMLLRKTGASEIHMSARKPVIEPVSDRQSAVKLGIGEDDRLRWTTDADKIRNVLQRSLL